MLLEIAIISGGKAPSKNLLDRYLDKINYIIAADSGCECLYSYNIIPDLIVGDFDSINKEILDKARKQAKEIIEFPPEKDYTDTEIAIMEGIKRGAKKIYLFGATGSRVDHMLGNIGLILTYKKKGIEIEVLDDNNRMYLAQKEMTLYGEFGENIGFHAFSDVVKNFKIKGAKYNIDEGYDMHLLDPRAICNEFLDNPIEISFDKGELLIIHSID